MAGTPVHIASRRRLQAEGRAVQKVENGIREVLQRSGGLEEWVPSFARSPPVSAAASAWRCFVINFVGDELPHVADVKIAVAPVEAEAPGIAQPERPDF